MVSRSLGVAIAVVLLAGCGGTTPDLASEERFIGRWFIEETEAHALYGASTYSFHGDGTIELVWDAGYYGFPQGYVQDAASGVRCFFGATWTGLDDDRLMIDGDCEDALDREIVLRFTNDASTNVERATVDIASVGGQSGWLPPQWGWSFRKCTADEACTGF